MIRTTQRQFRAVTRHISTSKSLLTGTTSSNPSSSLTENYKPETLTFQGNTVIKGSAEERMGTVFGGRLKGEARVSSSRKDAKEPCVIAGVTVPAKPTEPDNCCMSGCVNCVWEQYNDDLRDWRRKRNHAVEAIAKTEEVWPVHFDPPLSKLDFKNVAVEQRKEKRKLSRAKKVSTASYFPAVGKPGAQNVIKEQQEEERRLREEEEKRKQKEEEDEDWANVPVAMRAFAQTEVMLRKKKLEKAAKLKKEQEASAANIG